MDYARVKKIKRGGLRIEGMQVHGYNDHWKQVWWCLPAHDHPEQQPEQQDERDAAIRAAVVVVEATGLACALGESWPKPPT